MPNFFDLARELRDLVYVEYFSDTLLHAGADGAPITAKAPLLATQNRQLFAEALRAAGALLRAHGTCLREQSQVLLRENGILAIIGLKLTHGGAASAWKWAVEEKLGELEQLRDEHKRIVALLGQVNAFGRKVLGLE